MVNQDMWDDLKIPFGLIKYSQRYKEADKMLRQSSNYERGGT